jgi:hypothetical protein
MITLYDSFGKLPLEPLARLEAAIRMARLRAATQLRVIVIRVDDEVHSMVYPDGHHQELDPRREK